MTVRGDQSERQADALGQSEDFGFHSERTRKPRGEREGGDVCKLFLRSPESKDFRLFRP